MVTSMGETRALRVILAKPRGFCAGVVRAIDIVEQALRLYGAPVYVRHEIVHNKHVVASLRGSRRDLRGRRRRDPAWGLTVFSAHGVSRLVEQGAAARDLDVIDATCPLVHKVHAEGRRYAERGYDVVLIGHEGHAEVEGTRGQIGGRLQSSATRRDVDRIEVSDPPASPMSRRPRSACSIRWTSSAR